MAVTPSRIGPTGITGSDVTYGGTVPAGHVWLIRYIHYMPGNTGVGAQNHLTLSIGTGATGTRLYSQIGVSGSDQLEDGALERHVYLPLAAGEFIQAHDDGLSGPGVLTIGYEDRFV